MQNLLDYPLLLDIDYFFTEYTLGLAHSSLKGGLGPKDPARPETCFVLAISPPVFTLSMPCKISFHTLLIFVDRIVRVPFEPKLYSLAI